jgi:carbamate kinase
MTDHRSLVVALGGNAIHAAGGLGTIDEQLAVTRQSMEPVGVLVENGHDVILTHGNGPVVGNIMLRNEAVRDVIPPMPLYICDADSQGGLGLMLQQTLHNELVRRGIDRPVATVVTQVVVDADDPAFGDPTKPIGPFYGPRDAEQLSHVHDWVIREDSGRGYRRYVASPAPIEIVELPAIRTLVAAGTIVITVGGGGVPVVRRDRALSGIDAVVDKDRASALLAERLGFDTLVFVTAIDNVFVDFGRPGQRPLEHVDVETLARLHAEGQFPPGSMGPKIEATIRFLRAGGREAIIASPQNLVEALAGTAGTRVTAA